MATRSKLATWSSVLDFTAVTPSAVSTGVPVPRRRFQRGSLVEKSGRWYGVYRADVLQADGTFKREQCWQPLGLVSEQSERAAWRQLQPYLDKVNDAASKLPPKPGLTLAEFVEEWRAIFKQLVGIRGEARALVPEFRIFIVQPGVSKAAITDDQRELLSTTELYLHET